MVRMGRSGREAGPEIPEEGSGEGALGVRDNSMGVSALFPMIGPPRPGLEGPRGEVSGDRQDRALRSLASAAARRSPSRGQPPRGQARPRPAVPASRGQTVARSRPGPARGWLRRHDSRPAAEPRRSINSSGRRPIGDHRREGLVGSGPGRGVVRDDGKRGKGAHGTWPRIQRGTQRARAGLRPLRALRYSVDSIPFPDPSRSAMEDAC